MDNINKIQMGLLEVKTTTVKMKMSLDVINSRLDTDPCPPRKIRKLEDIAIETNPNEAQNEKKKIFKKQPQ